MRIRMIEVLITVLVTPLAWFLSYADRKGWVNTRS